MSKIHILPENISNRIAAGEVIERPASVVKELVENALDAGATSIRINIEGAGKKLISVADNGSGMDGDDALLCFEQHATSKIADIRDIEAITTMGFRGEALPSIASVSRLCLRTRQKDSLEGVETIIEGGRLLSSSPAGCVPGTEIRVRDLFFNTPARKKFLCSDNTEEKHISDMICQLALANREISFELVFDKAESFSSPGNSSLMPRIRQLLGSATAKALIPVKLKRDGISISGYIAQHGFTKKSRKEQRIFLNNRPIESFPVYRGIQNGYESLVMKGAYPPVVLFLTLDPRRVDINVHPAKREVRFREANLISAAVADAISQTLRSAAAPTAAVTSELSLDSILHGATVDYVPPPMRQDALPDIGGTVIPEITPENYPALPEQNASGSKEGEVSHETSGDKLQTSVIPGLKILAFLDETYILASSESGLVIIDQHAAHERVLFERLLRTAEKRVEKGAVSQRLLIPVTLDLSPGEVRFLKKNTDHFISLGFEVEPFGNNTVIIHAIPAILHENDVATFFTEVLGELFEEGQRNGRTDKAAVAKAACSKAVKAHDKLTFTEAEALLKQMGECSLPYSCPHGRPTIISISYKELEKRFGRI